MSEVGERKTREEKRREGKTREGKGQIEKRKGGRGFGAAGEVGKEFAQRKKVFNCFGELVWRRRAAGLLGLGGRNDRGRKEKMMILRL